MKIRIIILIVFLGFFSSCEKYLELKPKDTLVVNGMEEVRLMMSSYMASMTDNTTYQVTYNGKKMFWPFNRDVLAGFLFYSDDVDMMTVLGNSYSKKYEAEYFENKDWKGYLFANTLWSQLYGHIGYLTSVINEAERFKNEKNYAMVMGEALVTRAYLVFKLQQYFAPLDQEHLGVPLNLTLDEFRDIKRRPQKEIYAIILNDLNKALEIKGYNTQWNVFHTADITKLLLAQVYMYKAATVASDEKDWSEVEKYSSEIASKYSLEKDSAELAATMKPVANGYYKQNPFNLLSIGWLVTPRSNLYSLWGVGNSRMMPNVELLNLFSNDDIRKIAFFDSNNNFDKYSYTFYTLEDYHVLFRSTDAHLMQMEAEWMNGRKAEAKSKLTNFIKSRTGFQTVINDTNFEEILLTERRKEFFAEMDMRWIDIKRKGITIERKAARKNGQGVEVHKLSKGDYRYTLPIPNESELNYNGKIEQNPGW